MCAPAQRRRTMDHRPTPGKTTREQGRVLVLRWHDRAQTPHRSEIWCHRQRHEWPAATVRGVGDRPLFALTQTGQAGILAAPDLLGKMLHIGPQQLFWVEPPFGDAVLAPYDVKTGDPSEDLHASQQYSLVTD